jgi:ubiquinone/menaquinone biosynthesis C-methylase UbiE
VFALAADSAVEPGEAAARLKLQPEPTRMLLELLVGEGILARSGERYRLTRDARKWLDPESPTYVGTFIEHNLDYWSWWGDLEGALRDGISVELHRIPTDDPSWPVYIRGQYELARLSADDVAKAIRLPAEPASLLDVAGGHGWFAAALCRRHEGLRATVLDLPGSAAVGREIMAETGMSDRVRHAEGDMFEADLGGPHDGALCFDIVHHLQPDDVVRLFTRVRAALKPGGTLAVLDMFRGGPTRASAATLSLFFRLTSGTEIHSHDDLARFLGEAGFERCKRARIRSLPDQSLYQARAA